MSDDHERWIDNKSLVREPESNIRLSIIERGSCHEHRPHCPFESHSSYSKRRGKRDSERRRTAASIKTDVNRIINTTDTRDNRSHASAFDYRGVDWTTSWHARPITHRRANARLRSLCVSTQRRMHFCTLCASPLFSRHLSKKTTNGEMSRCRAPPRWTKETTLERKRENGRGATCMCGFIWILAIRVTTSVSRICQVFSLPVGEPGSKMSVSRARQAKNTLQRECKGQGAVGLWRRLI